MWNPDTKYDQNKSSFKVEYYDATESGAVTVFQEPGCSSWSGRFSATGDANQKAYYTMADLWVGHVWEDEASSIMVPYGYAAEIFCDDGFGGSSEIFTGKPYQDETM